LNQPNSPLTQYPPNFSLKQTIGHARRELAIQPYISKRRTHVDTTKDQEKAYMWFAVMEAIQVIKLMNAPTTTKTMTRPRPSHSLNLPILHHTNPGIHQGQV
jgi:hypothetical protein